MTIELTDNGKTFPYTLKEPGDLTIADYRLLKAEPMPDDISERERLVEMVKRLTGIPKTKLRRIPMGTFGAMLDTMGEHVEQLGKDIAASEASDPATAFEFDGIIYDIPQDLEVETLYGQWEDLHKLLLPQAGASEADVYKAVCAALCMQEGVEYSGSEVRANLEAFEALPIATAMAVTAFFFASSKRFRSDISRSILHYLTWNQPKEGQEPTSTPSDTEPSLDSLPLQN